MRESIKHDRAYDQWEQDNGANEHRDAAQAGWNPLGDESGIEG
jgi:hypothetical protein